jgi:hypothetical protein
MAIEEYEGIVQTCSHFSQLDVFEHGKEIDLLFLWLSLL